MRKRGKYEAVPVAAPKTNSNLLKAYLMSLVSLVITCAMFMGTTAAWFTAEVVNTGNQIQVGVLSVDLLHGQRKDEYTEWVSLKTETEHKVFGAVDQKWKPGSVDVQVLKVANDGQMALGYQVLLIADMTTSTDRDGNAVAPEMLEMLADHFKVFSASGENREFDPETWYYRGTLLEMLEGKPIYTGALEEETEEDFSVAIVMDTDVDNIFMGYKLEMYLKLSAYQGGEDFVAVSGEEDLRKALRNGGEILLLEDITIDEPLQVHEDSKITFNGKNLTFAHEEEEHQYAFCLSEGVHLILDAEDSTITVENGLVLVEENTNVALTMNGGTYLTPGATGEGSGLIYVPNGEGVDLTLEMENVTYHQEHSGWLVRFGDGDHGKMNMTMSGCTVSAGHGIRTAPSGTVSVADSTIQALQGLAIYALTDDGVTVTNSELSAAKPGSDLAEEAFAYTVATELDGTVTLDGCTVLAEEDMYPLAVLAGGGDITVQNCSVDADDVFIHEEAVGTVKIS